MAFFIACKKDPYVNETDLTGRRTRFADTVDMGGSRLNNLLVANTRQGNKFYMVGQGADGSYRLAKCDENAALEYARDIDPGNKNLMGITGSKVSDDFFTLSGNYDYTISDDYPINAFVLWPPEFDSLTPCDIYNDATAYEYIRDFRRYTYMPGNNTSVFKKFDKNGGEVWRKTLDGNTFGGKCLETDRQGNVYVLTATFNQEMQLNTGLSGLIPYYYMAMNACSFSIYKFDGEGNLIFKNTMNNVASQFSTGFNPRLAVSSNAIYVCSENFFYMFDKNGTFVSDKKPFVNRCNNSNVYLLARPEKDNAIVYTSIRYTRVNQKNYYMKLNNNNAHTVTELNDLMGRFLAVDSLDNVYAGTARYLIKLSATGEQAYFKNFSNTPYAMIVTGLVDKYNSFYSFGVNSGSKVLMYKYDVNGDFH